MDVGINTCPRPDKEGSDAFGGVKFVPGDGQQIHFETANVHFNLAAGLGSIGDASVRQLLQDEFNRSAMKSAQEKWKRLVKEAMAIQGLSNDQLVKLDNLLDLWPDLIIEAFVEGIGLFCRMPAAGIPNLAAVLSEMFLEEVHADHSRLN